MVVLGKEEVVPFALGNRRCPGPEIGSSLLYHYGNGFMVDKSYVFENKKFNGQIDFTGAVIDQKSGGLTGVDNIGGLWYGKLRWGMILT